MHKEAYEGYQETLNEKVSAALASNNAGDFATLLKLLPSLLDLVDKASTSAAWACALEEITKPEERAIQEACLYTKQLFDRVYQRTLRRETVELHWSTERP